MNRATAFATVLLTAAGARAQTPSELLPAKPTGGAELVIRYRPSAARPLLGDALWAALTFHTDNGYRHQPVPLAARDDGGGFGATTTVPDDAHFITCRFVSASAWDRRADCEAMVYGRDGQPRRGAVLRTVFDAGRDFQTVIDRELTAYPDNFAAYREKWFVAGVYLDAGQQRDMVRADLERLAEHTTAVALWARGYGRLLLGDEPRARELVLRAAAEHPTAGATARAISDYEYQVFAQQIEGEGPARVAAAKAALIESHPGSWLARDQIRVVASRDGFPLRAVEAVCQPWMREQPRNPEPAYVLAAAYQRQRRRPQRAAELIEEAIEGFLRGRMRLFGDVAGTATELFMLPNACRAAAKLARDAGNEARALAFARAAQAVDKETDARDIEFEAALWERLGHRPRAELCWARALAHGSTTARSELARLHAAGGHGDHSLDERVSELLAEIGTGSRPAAPPFEATDLDGSRVRLADLRGRVVVVNFWGLGCAPCKVEIPDLNRLAEDYSDRPVEFLAFAGDPADKIRAYLAEHPFAYRQVAAASSISRQFGVAALPTHLIIDGKGRIVATLTGGGVGRDAALRPLIDLALAEL